MNITLELALFCLTLVGVIVGGYWQLIRYLDDHFGAIHEKINGRVPEAECTRRMDKLENRVSNLEKKINERKIK